eukprot:TRINITY_DN8304_c0_g1_i1.p1 TRINITY_DN8304_c0_g1~~TRINITY_DN8304_c0_g1_i1.p1  ORF type:complete len:876 (+),score=130.44 TRINITY_DN8304_c0_g1_i1:42-2669(+)
MGVVGIRTLTLGLAISLVVVTGVTLGSISVSTGNKAIDDARETGDKGVQSCLASGRRNIERLTVILLNSILSEFRVKLTTLMAAPLEAAEEVASFIENRHPDVSSNPVFIDSVMRPILANKQRSSKTTENIGVYLEAVSPNSDSLSVNGVWGGLVIYIHGYDHSSLFVVETRVDSVKGPFGLSENIVISMADELGKPSSGNCKSDGGVLEGVCPLSSLDKPRNVAELEDRCYRNSKYADPSLPLLDEKSSSYSPVNEGTVSGSMTVCRVLSHPDQIQKYPRQGTRIGYVTAAFSTREVSERMNEATLPAGSLLYSIQRNPWTGLIDHLTGSNLGQDNYRNTVNGITRQYPFPVVNHTLDGFLNGTLSPIARHARSALYQEGDTTGSYYRHWATKKAEVGSWEDPATGILYWVGVNVLQYSDIYWFVCLLSPRDSVMGDLDRTELQILRQVAEDKESTDDDRRNSFVLMYCITAVCTVFLIGLSVALTKKIVSPLDDLSRQMAAVALMQTENVDVHASYSALCEVADMQKSFRQMIKNLIEYKSYLPQSALYQDTTTSEDEGDTSSVRNSNIVVSSSDTGASFASTDLRVPQTQVSDVSLKIRCVSVIMFNSVGWHKTICVSRSSTQTSIIECHKLMIEKIINAVLSGKGMPDSFSGDRLMAHFNSVRPNASHVDMAALAAYRVVDEPRDDRCPKISFAVTSGEARVGNIGTNGMKRFSILSPIVPFAAALESLNVQLGTRGLCDDAVSRQSVQIISRAAKVVLFKKAFEGCKIAYEIVSDTKPCQEEWMYLLENAGSHEYASWNAASRHIRDGSYDAAVKELAEFETQESDDVLYKSWMTSARTRTLLAVDLSSFGFVEVDNHMPHSPRSHQTPL